jgi:hypothetical protein
MASELPASLEKDQGRDAADIESAGQRLLFVGVHLANLQCSGTSLSRLVQHGRHHLAGPAPWRPEIDEDRYAAFGCMGHERFSIQRNHLATEKLRFALGTLGVLTHAVRRGTYDGVALGAGDQNRICR